MRRKDGRKKTSRRVRSRHGHSPQAGTADNRQIERRQARFSAGIVVLVVCLVLTVAGLLLWPVLFPEKPPPPPVFHTRLQPILTEYIERNGGENYLESINSVRMTGTMSYEGQDYHVVLVKKRPNQVRMNMTKNRVRLIMAYDGERAWKSLTLNGQTQASVMTGLDAAVMEREAEFDSPLIDYQRKGHTLTLKGRKVINGHDCYVIDVNTINDRKFTLYLDGMTYETVLQEEEALAEDGVKTVRTFFKDYRKQGKMWVAFHIATFIEEKESSVLIFEETGTNQGFINAYFAVPEDLQEN